MEAFLSALKAGNVTELAESFSQLNDKDKQILAQQEEGSLAVYLASAQDETLLAQLLEAKFSAAHVDQNGETALHKVVKANRAGAVSTLLSAASCLPNAADGHLQTALHRAGELGHAKCMAILLKSERVNIDAEDAWRRTALHWTAQKGMLSETKILIARGAKPIFTENNESPLHWAVRGGHADQVDLLLQTFPELNVYAVNDRGESPMEIARTFGYDFITKRLWEHGQQHNQVPPTLNTVVNESQVHDTGAVRTNLAAKPKGGPKKLTLKKLDS